MSETFWTLEYDGDELTLDDWGFEESSLSCFFGNLVVDTFHARLPGSTIDDDEVIPFEGQVTIRRGRAAAQGGGFSGGTIEFQGKRLLHLIEGRPGFEGITYQFGGPWYDLDQTPYQQEYVLWEGSPPAKNLAYSSETILFLKLDETLGPVWITTGEQITRTLQYCLATYTALSLPAPFQIGTIGITVKVNTYQVRDMKCSEVIHHCLRASPDAVLWFDYTTSPPTVNVTKRANMTPVNVTLADASKHETLRLTPRYDLQPRSVVIYFKQTSTSDDNNYVSVITQKYPVDGAIGGPGVIVQTVDLDGWHATTVKGSLECAAFANTRTWWENHFAELKTLRCRRFRIGPLTYTDEDTGVDVTLAATTIKDAAGNAVSLITYPNVLLDGTPVTGWMKLPNGNSIVAVKATITAEISCKQYDVDAVGDPETSTNGRLLSKYFRKQIEAHVTLTNAVTGHYSTIASFTSAESYPSDLSQNIYTSLATLQYQGSFSFVESECSGSIRMGNTVNLLGLRSEWAAMVGQIQQVHRDYGSPLGMRTTVSIGPASHLNAGDLTQLFLINRYRRVWKNPTTMSSGKSDWGSKATEIGDKVAGINSLGGLTESSKKTVSALIDEETGDKNVLGFDAEEHELKLAVVDSSGSDVAGFPKVSLKMLDLQYA